MNTTKIKQLCKNLIALCDDLESTDNKGESNDIMIDISNTADDLGDEIV
jgi:hypothetical protein